MGSNARQLDQGRRSWRWVRKLATLGLSVALTFLGLLFVTFLIGRVVPIDPVLAAVGDRAPAEVYERVRIELGLHLPLYQQFFVYMAKVFQGEGFDDYQKALKQNFKRVVMRKPKASRARSREIYALATGYKPQI